MTMWHCWKEARKANKIRELPPVEAKEKVKASKRAKRRTIPKSNVGIVKRWDTMLLCVQRRKTRKGKRKQWQRKWR